MTENKKYQIIYADPPWRYEHLPIGSKNRAIENHYPTMSLTEIKKLPVKELSAENSVLFLWATAPKLKECIEVMIEWGYQYRTCAVWDKETIGMGYWFRNQHELLLIGLKGQFSPPTPPQRVSSILKGKKTEHSKKPNSIRQLISSWYPNITKLELFARQNQSGLFEKNDWDVWGNEVESDINL